MVEQLLVRKKVNNSALAKGKVFQHVVHTKTVEWEDFIDHIRDHGSCYSRGVVMGVMQDMVECLVEICRNSMKVRLANLGTFYMSVGSEGCDSFDQSNVDSINRVHLRFTPSLTSRDQLDSVSLRKKVHIAQSENIFVGDGSSGSSSPSTGGSDTPTVEQPGD